MPKRRATEQLTGGTGDVNPQYMSGTVVLSAANTATTVTLAVPISRVPQPGASTATIIEILKCYVNMPLVDVDAAAVTNRSSTLAFSTTSFGATAVAMNESRVFAWVTRQLRNCFTAAGTAMIDNVIEPVMWDCTDGAGHGILVATDNIFIQGVTANQTGASTFDFKILYRFKDVSLVEYIGIVQSQQ
jgi:hypothetical protein